jgi:hypothetical protein
MSLLSKEYAARRRALIDRKRAIQGELRNARGVGSVKAILLHPQTGALMGAVSPTGDSYVMGW